MLRQCMKGLMVVWLGIAIVLSIVLLLAMVRSVGRGSSNYAIEASDQYILSYGAFTAEDDTAIVAEENVATAVEVYESLG